MLCVCEGGGGVETLFVLGLYFDPCSGISSIRQDIKVKMNYLMNI